MARVEIGSEFLLLFASVMMQMCLIAPTGAYYDDSEAHFEGIGLFTLIIIGALVLTNVIYMIYSLV